MSEKAFISIGSNIEPERNLNLAVKRLHGLGNVIAISHVYQSPAVGTTDQADFLNAAAMLVTELDPVQIRQRLRAIEANLGRVRVDDKYAGRTIDLDLCLYGNVALATPEITLPHPDIPDRAYVAVPLSELAPDLRHPATGESLADLAARLRDGARLTRRSDIELGTDSME